MIYRFDRYTLDTDRLELRCGTELVAVEPQVFRLLVHLIENRDRVVGKDELFDTVWEGRIVSDATLNTRINALRRALGDDGKAQMVVRTFPRRGFRFIADVVDEERRPPQSRLAAAESPRAEGDNQSRVSEAGAVMAASQGSEQVGHAEAASSGDPELGAAARERRHLTVMVSELGGSTPLSERLDPEEFAEVVVAYQSACRRIVADFDGFVASALGETVLAYFGYPQAHEDDAERSIRAALRIVDQIRRLGPGGDVELSVKVGIATGLVIIGDMAEGTAPTERSVLGQTPAVAAGLQTLAEANSVVIADSTRRLVEGMFVWDDYGPVEIRDFSEPVRVYRVREESEAPSRFEAAAQRWLTPLVGREEEIGLLLKRWEEAKEGEGQVVLLSGEAGFGKSRIVRDLKERLAGELQNRVLYYCSPHYRNSALYPCVDQLERALRFETGDAPEQKLDKLEAWLGELGLPVPEVAPHLAALLSLPEEERYPRLDGSPEELKRKALESLIAVFEVAASRSPVLAVVEDAHWIDPSTLEFLDLLVERLRSAPILLVITFRPEFEPAWTGHAHCTTLTLNRLGRRDSATMVGELTGGMGLPQEVLDEILAKSDGVPLFLEELVRAVLELDIDSGEGRRHVLARPRPPLAIPESLQDSLTARLDRLGSAKSVAQLAATVGRTFRHDLLAEVFRGTEADLESALSGLIRSGLIYRRGAPPGATYDFKHVLLQEAAYRSLLKKTRQDHHERIARTLATSFPETVETEPEIVAHHLTEAGLVEEAIGYWRRAGERASQRFANAEAVAHLTRGIELIENLPERSRYAEEELKLLLAFAPALMITKAPSAPEVVTAYTRARELCDSVGDTAQTFQSTWGLWFTKHIGGHYDDALAEAEKLLQIGKRQSDKGLLLQAYHSIWTSRFTKDELDSVRESTERGIALYDSDMHRHHAFLYGGHDPGVCCRAINGVTLWFLGLPDQAQDRLSEGVSLAETLAHPFSLAIGLGFSATMHMLRREPQRVLVRTRAVSALCDEQGTTFGHFGLTATLLEGWAMAAQGRTTEGIEQMKDCLAAVRATGFQRLSFQLSLIAEAHGWAGHIEQGIEALDEAIALVETTGERRWEPFAYRLKGELLRHRPGHDPAEVEACFTRAIDVSRRQNAGSFELRAAISLAQLHMDRGKAEQALEWLAPVYDRFTEGFETPDLRDAKALLEDLR